MLEDLRKQFEDHFGHKPAHIMSAPGRVNLIGEHTDYNLGFALPCAIEHHTLVAISPRSDNSIQALSLDCDNQSDVFSADELPKPHPSQPWANYLRGVASQFMAPTLALSGCNIAITGNIPQGAGLSSSAALEVSLAGALAVNNGIELSNFELAKIGQNAENNFVGCNCGIMDQLISAGAVTGHAALIDCQSNTLTQVPVPERLSIVIIDSNVKRELVDSEYNDRREQCQTAARELGASSLRDVETEQFQTRKMTLNPLVAKRAQHVLEENQRTIDAADALLANDIARLSQLLAASHESMRTLFDITVPPIDFLVSQVHEVLGTSGGVRMTGGGFGGCIVALMPAGLVDDVVTRVKQTYYDHTGIREDIYVTRPVGGLTRIQ